ncbi:MAG: NCS2 family permease, partial [Clostridia bacterium]|nr:NCS2 family permease [Clostridia bacterium]
MENEQQVQPTQEPQKKVCKLDTFFGVTQRGSTIKTEIIAGIVTFLAMCYILTVNPNQILWGGALTPDGATFVPTDNVLWPSIFIATALGAIIGTLLMAFLAKMPLAQASGMGLNSLVGTVIGGGVGFVSTYVFNFTIGHAMAMVLISGIIFLLLSVISINGKSFRELIFDGMPVAVRGAISVGIGLFIAYIGFQNAGIIVTNQYTQVGLVDFTNWGNQLVHWQGVQFDASGAVVGGALYYPAAKTAVVALIGFFLIALLDYFKVRGSIIIGILGATIIGIPMGVTNLGTLAGGSAGISWKFWENFGNFFAGGENSVFGSFTQVFTQGFPEGSLFTIIMIIITMCMIDMFDTMGTIVGCCGGNRYLSDENNKPYNYDKIMISDSVATCLGAMLGTSTVTTFVESGAGVAAGGRTGLTALTTAVMFFIAMFAMPVFATIPSAATASALIYVGVLMMKNNVKYIDFSDAVNSVSAFLTIVVMILSYSITKGIGIGMVTYTVLSIIAYFVALIGYACKKDKEGAEKPKF